MEKVTRVCLNCEEMTKQEHKVDVPRTIVLGDESIDVLDTFYTCLQCGEEIDDDNSPDILALAYAEYERRTGKKWLGNK